MCDVKSKISHQILYQNIHLKRWAETSGHTTASGLQKTEKEDSAVHFHYTWREYILLSVLPMLRRQLAERREKWYDLRY